MDCNQSWDIITNYLCNKTQDCYTEAELRPHLELLHQHGLAVIIEEWFYETIQQHIREQIKPAFWANFLEEIPVHAVIEHLQKSFNDLHTEFEGVWPSLERLKLLLQCTAQVTGIELPQLRKSTQAKDDILLYIKAIIFHAGNENFNQAVIHFYKLCFKAFDANTKGSLDMADCDSDEEAEEEALMCDGCDNEKETCTCQHILNVFHIINSHLKELGVLERISGEAISALIHCRIKKHVEHTCKGNFETQYINSLEEWLDIKVVGWLNGIYSPHQKQPASPEASSSTMLSPTLLTPPPYTQPSPPDQSNPIAAHKGRLYHYMYEAYARIRIQQLFDVIIEYPDSEPALMDLKCCLEKTNLRGELVKSLKTALETRLLHPGVNTSDILTAYISAIRALRGLDPTGVLLDLVCEPVRKYLRNREDTVRCIVSSLTEDGNNELSDELIKGRPLVLDESYCSDDDEDWENWTPDPVDADPAKSSSSRRSSDIISMLVNIYGSKELFVNEYRTLLADRILTHFNYDTEKEIRYLELLKMRFGEAQLHHCEVMLKDVSDSKRINSNINDERQRTKGDAHEEQQDIPVNSMILSAQFWPAFREEKLQLPEHMQTCLEKYTKSFAALKGNRTLNWKPHLGLVELEVELKDRVLNLRVSPTHAAIIWYFQQKERWTVSELSSKLQMSVGAVRRKLALWQSHGVLREDGADAMLLVEKSPRGGDGGSGGGGGGNAGTTDVILEDDDEAESAMASAADQREEEFQMIWQYVTGMLTNLESLPLDRIHSMLKMFAMTGPGADCTVHELKAFLDKKVKEQKLLFVTGVYRLAKTS